MSTAVAKSKLSRIVKPWGQALRIAISLLVLIILTYLFARDIYFRGHFDGYTKAIMSVQPRVGFAE